MKRSSVDTLPTDVRGELDRLLVSSGFADYTGLSTWLEAKGWSISRSALHRYGQRFEERLGALKVATEQARAIAEASPDDEGAVNDAVLRLCQERMLQTVLHLEDDDVAESMPRISRAVADLSRASVGQKRWMSDVRARAKEVAEEVAATSKKAGLSEETVKQIQARILGIVS